MFLEMTTFNLRYIWSSPTLISGSLNKSVILGRLEWCDFGCWKYQSKTCWCCRFCWCWQWRACWPLVGDSWQLGNSLPCSATARQKLFSTFTFSFQYFWTELSLFLACLYSSRRILCQEHSTFGSFLPSAMFEWNIHVPYWLRTNVASLRSYVNKSGKNKFTKKKLCNNKLQGEILWDLPHWCSFCWKDVGHFQGNQNLSKAMKTWKMN